MSSGVALRLAGQRAQVFASSRRAEPLERLASEGELMAYRHDGFFYAMDTYREYQQLNEMWASCAAPWKIWE